MTYETSNKTRTVVLLVIGFVVLSFVAYGQRYAIKERYFAYVLSSCKDLHGVKEIAWEEIPAFDASVRRLRTDSKVNIALVECADSRARWIIEDGSLAGDGSKEFRSLEVSISGSNLSPPQHIYNIRRSISSEADNHLIDNDAQKN